MAWHDEVLINYGRSEGGSRRTDFIIPSFIWLLRCLFCSHRLTEYRNLHGFLHKKLPFLYPPVNKRCRTVASVAMCLQSGPGPARPSSLLTSQPKPLCLLRQNRNPVTDPNG
ncbi:hypothetical protein AVEN_231329-1 [Araneus ventricosus]|uniref:Uncharacterized protein n=1 Tax=Araneus ventricosus TaxID=182803 RepID=A0A4Y2CIX0_ARAVE|nr:hypothetical protein AVEN_231329-1 [Araneus ventricosus]